MKLNRRQVLKAGLAASTVYSPWMLGIAQSKPVYIGVIRPVTGPPNEGYDDSVAYWRENGDINGRPVEWVVEDVGPDPTKGLEGLNRLLTRAPETVLLYAETFALVQVIAPEIKRLMMPFTPHTYFTALTNRDNYPSTFLQGPTFDQHLLALLPEIKRQKSNATVALLFADSFFGRDPLTAFKAQAAKDGVRIVAEIPAPPAINDAAAAQIAPRLLEASADFVVIQGYIQTGEGQVMKAARAAGVKSVFMGGFGTTSPTLLQTAGPAADGYIGSNHTLVSSNNAPIKETIRKFRASKGKQTPDILFVSNIYIFGWRLNAFIYEALRRADAAGKLTRPGVLEALENMSDFNGGGLIHSFKFVKNHLPYTQLHRLDAAAQNLVPASDWISFA